MEIRLATLEDQPKIARLIYEVFTNTEHGYGNEAELVANIRQTSGFDNTLELVATEHEELVGHGLLSEVAIVNDDCSYIGLVLAPLAAAINYQGKGVGTKLMTELEARAVALNYPFISILDHPDYYPRFGYLPASQFDVKAPFEVPEEAFMIKPLLPGALEKIQGKIQYSKAFD